MLVLNKFELFHAQLLYLQGRINYEDKIWKAYI